MMLVFRAALVVPAVLLALGLGACAAHNSHRVQVDLVNDFDALVDEAYGALVEAWPANEPGGTIGTSVEVERVVVRWWPLAVDPAEPVFPIEQDYMAQRVEQRLWQLMGGPPDRSRPADYVIEAELETDLHDSASILYGVRCSLARADGTELARGYSRLVELKRLFCHGCNEAWGGHGANLRHPSGGPGVGVAVGVGFWGGYCPPSSGPTYIKVR
jgi:hypothetical protein